MNPNDMSEDQLRKLARSLSNRKNRNSEEQVLLAKVRSEIAIRCLGIEVSSGYEHHLAQWTWRVLKNGQIATNFTKLDGRKTTMYLGQALWSQLKGIKLNDVVGGVKVNRTSDIAHARDYRSEVLTDSDTDWRQAVTKVERSDIPEQFWGLRYVTGRGGYQKSSGWGFRLSLSRKHQKYYTSLRTYDCPAVALAAMTAVKAVFKDAKGDALLPYEDMKIAELTTFNNLVKLGKETQVPMYVKQLSELPQVPQQVLDNLKAAAVERELKMDEAEMKGLTQQDIDELEATDREVMDVLSKIDIKPFKLG